MNKRKKKRKNERTNEEDMSSVSFTRRNSNENKSCKNKWRWNWMIVWRKIVQQSIVFNLQVSPLFVVFIFHLLSIRVYGHSTHNHLHLSIVRRSKILYSRLRSIISRLGHWHWHRRNIPIDRLVVLAMKFSMGVLLINGCFLFVKNGWGIKINCTHERRQLSKK